MVSANDAAEERKLLGVGDYLPDPLNDRVIKGVKPPPHRPLSSKLAFRLDDNGTQTCNTKLV